MSKPERIVLVPGFSWKRRLAIFSGVYAGLWLYLKPLGTFGVATELFESLGVWGYAGLLGISLLATMITEMIHKRRQLGKMDFVAITMVWQTDGSRHNVAAPADIKAEIFANLFLDYIVQNPGASDWRILRRNYDWTIVITREGQEIEVPADQTLRQGGVKAGDECSLKGEIKPNRVIARPCC